MAAIALIDFEDIYTAVLELLKIQASDTTTIARIKRDINIGYQDILGRYNFWWARSLVEMQTVAKRTTGTVNVTSGSANITFSSGPSASVAGYQIKINGFQEVYTISTHTAAATAAVLAVPFLGTTDTVATYVLWKDFVELPTDCNETVMVAHQFVAQPLTSMGLTEFRRVSGQQPDREGVPLIYTTDDYNSSVKRRLRVWPAVYSTAITLDIDYMMDVARLDADGDEPAMPLKDRIVLYYYALSQAWARERNDEKSIKYMQLYEGQVAKMISKGQDSSDSARISINKGYLQQKRMRRRSRNSSND